MLKQQFCIWGVRCNIGLSLDPHSFICENER